MRATSTTGKEKKCELTSDFSGLEAGSADVLAFGVTVDQSANALDIWVPAATGTTI